MTASSVRIGDDLRAGRGQLLAAEGGNAHFGIQRTQSGRQGRSVAIPAGFAAGKEDMPGARATSRSVSSSGPSGGPPHRTIPRSDRRMKAIRSSMCRVSLQSAAIRSSAWVTFRPER